MSILDMHCLSSERKDKDKVKYAELKKKIEEEIEQRVKE